MGNDVFTRLILLSGAVIASLDAVLVYSPGYRRKKNAMVMTYAKAFSAFETAKDLEA